MSIDKENTDLEVENKNKIENKENNETDVKVEIQINNVCFSFIN